MKRRYIITWIVSIGIGLGVSAWGVLRHRSEMPGQGAACGGTPPAYWYDPMHPGEHFGKPGKSPYMDMPLAPKCAQIATATERASAPPGSIEIDSRIVQSLGIRVSPVEQGRFERGMDTVGLVGVDEHRIEAIQVRQAGWVEELHVRAAGDAIRRGQALAGVYSPELLAAEQELLIARDSRDSALAEAARSRLALFGLPAGQIARIEQTGHSERRVEYYAPFDGYVMELGARQGAAVLPGTTLFQVARLDSVWITAEIPEVQAAWIKPGDAAEIGVAALPGVHLTGRVEYLYPELSQATRTLRVRLVVQNPQDRLRPGMFASVHLFGTALENVLTVPSEAVIRTGVRSIVIVADDGTHYRPVAVRVGAEQGDRSQILDGLSRGQTVVASGQFLIDSEASLRGALGAL